MKLTDLYIKAESKMSALLTVPPEISCLILEHVDDVVTIKSIILTGNRYLTELMMSSIKRIYQYDSSDELPVSIMKQLVKLETVEIPIADKSFDDITELTSLPCLSRFDVITTLSVSKVSQFASTIVRFISKCCQNAERLIKKRFSISSKISRTDNMYGNAIKLQFVLTGGYFLIVGLDNNDEISWVPSIGVIINFLTIYREYVPLKCINDFTLCPGADLDILTSYLATVPELEMYSFSTFRNELTPVLIKKLIDKIKIIQYNMFPWDCPKINIIEAFSRDNLRLFPVSEKIIEFIVPIKIDDVPFVLEKYPNIEHISIVYNEKILTENLQGLTEYLQGKSKIKRINVITNNPKLIPTSNKFHIITNDSNYKSDKSHTFIESFIG